MYKEINKKIRRVKHDVEWDSVSRVTENYTKIIIKHIIELRTDRKLLIDELVIMCNEIARKEGKDIVFENEYFERWLNDKKTDNQGQQQEDSD